MKRLSVDISELASVMFSSDSPDYGNFLDTKTGEVLLVESHLLNLIEERLWDGTLPEQDEPPDMTFLLEKKGLPAWQEGMLQDAYRIQTGFPDSVIRIPGGTSGHDWHDMADFIETVQDSRLADRLRDAIDGRGAFSRFGRIVYDQPALGKEWNSFREARQQQRATEWLESEGIEVAETEQ